MTGADLREARKAAGLSMKQAAEESKTPYRTWQDWEGGKRRVPGLAFSWLALRTKALVMVNVADYEMRKQIFDGQWPKKGEQNGL